MSSDRAKEAAGRAAARLLRDGMRVGLGTGSTAHWFIVAAAEAVRSGLRLQAVPTSEGSGRLAAELGIELVELDRRGLDLAVDGADQIDLAAPPDQGRWGARPGEGGGRRRPPLRGGRRSHQHVAQLRVRIPFEILRFGEDETLAALEEACGSPSRCGGGDGTPEVSDFGNVLGMATSARSKTPRGWPSGATPSPGWWAMGSSSA